MRQALHEFFALKGADFDARLFLWYAGHGHSIAGEGFLVPADAPPPTDPRFKLVALHMRSFESLMRLADATHVLSVFDACFSGTIFSARSGAVPAAISAKTTQPVRQFITSGTAGQQVRDDGSFRTLFLRALSGAEDADVTDDGFVTGDELGLYLSQKVASLTDAAQTPQYGKLHDVHFNEGDFVFRLEGDAAGTRRPAKPEAAPKPNMEALFWRSVKDSEHAADFEAYLKKFPDGLFADLARNRLETLRQVATLPRSRQLEAGLQPVEATYVAVKDALVRDAPAVGGAGVLSLAAGTEIYVAGKTADGKWLKVERQGESLGYVYAPLLQERGAWRAAERKRRLAAKGAAKPSGGPGPTPAVGTYPEGRAAGDSFRDCERCPEMVVLPAGSFLMGSPADEAGRGADEGPQHRVTIQAPFAVGKFEVSFAEWEACVRDGGCNGHRPDDRGWGRGRRPVIDVGWDDAKAYIAWISKRTGKAYRLLSEAEWEYAARAGGSERRPWGDDRSEAEICRHANGADQRARQRHPGWRVAPCDDGHLNTAPVGSYRANAFGLHDLIGNVWEWVEDCWARSYAGAASDGGARSGDACEGRVLRGGAWNESPRALRSADRHWDLPDGRHYAVGFRVARGL
jgi:formylglycine-generating enzyme required for sulfatase activity